jgi:hypothetical protein
MLHDLVLWKFTERYENLDFADDAGLSFVSFLKFCCDAQQTGLQEETKQASTTTNQNQITRMRLYRSNIKMSR